MNHRERRAEEVIRAVLFVLTFLAGGAIVHAQQLAFPGAEGFGRFAVGGRGGVVYEVTNLDDSGEGSLREAINASGPRTVVFRVSGTIAIQSSLKINNPYITIAGQTAPGDGICLKDYQFSVSADHSIVRFIRSRLGDNQGQETDSLSVGGDSNVILDHCSASWSVDETLSVTGEETKNVTVQWCFITESLNDSIHTKGPHGYGSLIRGERGHGYTFHHNFYAHHRSRCPRPGNYIDYLTDPDGLLFDFRNNVIYNWSGKEPGYNADENSITKMNYVGNYLKLGTNSSLGYAFDEGSTYNRGYFAGNYYNGSYPVDPWSLVDFGGFSDAQIAAYKQSAPFDFAPVQTDDAITAYQRVLEFCGALYPNRDAADERLLADLVNGTGRIIDDEDEVGGWPTLNSATPPDDTDRDGMPDDWETARGLNPHSAADRNDDRNGDGYTNLENYLNYLVRPTITVAASKESIPENGGGATFTISRTGYNNYPLTVNLAVAGTASPGEDYSSLAASVQLATGTLETTIQVSPLDDPDAEGPESIVLTVLENSDAYRVDVSSGAATIVLQDDDAAAAATGWTRY